MADETDLFARAIGEAPFAGLVADGRPALVFDRSGERLLWANAAGAAYVGLADRAALAAWRLAAAHPLARRIAALYERLAGGKDRIERLALPHGPLPRLVVSRASRILIAPDKAVLLLVVDGGGVFAGDPLAAYRRFAGLDPAPTEAAAVAETPLPAAETPLPAAEMPLPAAETQAPEAAAMPPVEPAADFPAESPPAPEAGEAAEAAAAVVPQSEPAPVEPIEPIAAADVAAAETEALARPTPVVEPAVMPEPAEAEAPAEALLPPAAFAFPEHGRAVRFVFELDCGLVVRFVSDDLAAVVGPANAAIVGLSWGEVVRRLDLDPRGRLAAALARHDTFTGFTVDWPVEGQPLRVPVDLAGMPVFGRSRAFSGYRGFGVAKTGAAFQAPVVDAAWPQVAAAVPAPTVPEDVGEEGPAPDVALPAAEDRPPAEPAAAPVTEAPVTEAPVTEAPVTEAAIGEADEVAAGVAPRLGESVEAPPAAEVDEAPPQAGETASGTAGVDEVPAAEEPPPSAEVIMSPIVARPLPPEADGARSRLSKPERDAFDKIAEALAEAFGTHGGRRASPPAAAAATGEPATEPVRPNELAEAPRPSEPPLAARPALPLIDAGLLDRLPVALAILRDGEIVHANRGFLDLAGYGDLGELGAAGGFPAVFEGSALPRDASIPAIRRKDGIELPVSARLHTVEWGGEFASLLVVQETAATTSRDRLAVAEQRVEDLEAILDTATDGVLVLDHRGLIIGANRSAEALFGAERARLLGATLVDQLAPESHRIALDYLDSLSRNGLSSVLNDGREVIAKVAGGGLVPLFMTIGRVSLTKYCAVLRDITQWKRAEEELTAAKRQAETASSQKSDFLAKMSHEIRTPLNAIIGFSEVMMEERFGPIGNDRYKEYLRDIHVSGTHIMSLVNDLLDLSKIEAGKLELTFESVGLNDVVRECAALMQPQANRERVIIRTSLSSSLPPVVADSRSLRQIVLNLLSNAVKFNNPGGQVIVSTIYEPAGEVVLRVRDTGQGMSEGDVVKAMEPFRQLNTTRAGQGTGLGLPLTKALVEANRAAFRIDSTPGQGTLVQITFPSTRVLAE